MKSHQSWGGRAKAAAIVIIQIAIFIWLIERRYYLGAVVFCIMLAGLIIWKKWYNYVLVKQQIETMIFGKPLVREYWKKGELAKLKIKLQWKKEKEKSD